MSQCCHPAKLVRKASCADATGPQPYLHSQRAKGAKNSWPGRTQLRPGKAGSENSKREQCSGRQINLPAMDVPDALPNDQHRYDPKLVPCRPLISIAYGLLVVRRIDDLIVEVNGLAVFAVGEFGKVALIDHVSSPCCVLAASIRKVDQRGPLYAESPQTPC